MDFDDINPRMIREYLTDNKVWNALLAKMDERIEAIIDELAVAPNMSVYNADGDKVKSGREFLQGELLSIKWLKRLPEIQMQYFKIREEQRKKEENKK